MTSSNSSADSGFAEESELSRREREGKERRKILENALKETELFDMSKDDYEEGEGEEIEEQSIEEETSDLSISGIKFFNGNPNCIYNQDSLKNEITLLKQHSELDFQALMDLKDKVLYDHIIESYTEREQLFSSLFKLLFTCQSHSFLEEISKILIFLAQKSNEAFPLLKIILDTLPIGIKNLGGNVSKIFEAEKFQNIPPQDAMEVIEDRNLCLAVNIRYVVNMLQYTLKKAILHLKGKLHFHNNTVDDLVFLLIVVSQDPAILHSNAIPSIQNCLHGILDIYPSDWKYLKKIQDIVERIAIYWGDSVEGFSHTLAYITCCEVIPSSIRGKKLRSSLAYCSLAYCLPDYELEIVDKTTLCNLSIFCQENVKAFSRLDFQTLYSVLRLIDAAIVRPVIVNKDMEYIKLLIATIDIIFPNTSSDALGKAQFQGLVTELKLQWSKLIDPLAGARNSY